MAKELITGAEILMRSLVDRGVTTLFGYPGGAIMPVFDALYDYRDKLNHILVRHEQGAAHAAEGYARVSGKVGVCLVTSGPGATNTITGIADAMLDSTPIVVITGQVGASLLGTDAFQECDVVNITQPICKWAYQIRSAADVAWAVNRAFYIASSGRPGPVVLDFAKNAQTELAEYRPVKVDFIRSYVPVPATTRDSIEEAAALINAAERPLVLIGQGVELGNAQEEVRAFIEKADAPAGCTLLGLSALPSDHRLNVGMLGMHGSLAANTMTQKCDLLIAVGMRFDDRVTGNLATYARQAKKIHFDIDPAEVNKNVPVDVAVLGDCKNTLPAVTALLKRQDHKTWVDAFSPYAEKEDRIVIQPEINPVSGPIRMGEVARKVSEHTAHKAILVTDVGQNQLWTTQFLELKGKSRLITSGGLGTMGYGLPAAIGAKLGCPDMPVVCVSGDGGVQMNIQELATAVCQEIPLTLCILNNSYLGNVRQWQEMFFGGKYACTCLRKRKSCGAWCSSPHTECPPYIPDFVRLAESYGLEGIRVTDRRDIAAAFDRAEKNTKAPTVIEFIIDRESNVLPIVPGGNALSEMVMEFKKEGK